MGLRRPFSANESPTGAPKRAPSVMPITMPRGRMFIFERLPESSRGIRPPVTPLSPRLVAPDDRGTAVHKRFCTTRFFKPMASQHSQDNEDLHFRVLKLLLDNPDTSQRELAVKLGVSNGKLHYCLNALIDKGLVKLGNFANSKHHLGYAYLLTPAGLAQKAALTSRFLKRKMAEYEALRAEIEALQKDIQRPDATRTLTPSGKA